MNERPEIVCIACSIFRSELEALREHDDLAFQTRYLDSVLHLYPDRLRRELDGAIDRELNCGKKVVLLYGDCHAYMLDCARTPGVARVDGINCCRILLDDATFRDLCRQGVFFLLPEWTLRWRDLLPLAFGLSDAEAKNMMREAHAKLVYLDTGLQPIPLKELHDLSDYTGLPFEIAPVSLDGLKAAILTAIQRLDLK